MADEFVLVRIVNMRGVDLNRIDFDFDLTWAALFLNEHDYVYGRYGSRDEGPADAGLSLSGLKYAMQQALKRYREHPDAKPDRPTTNARGEFPRRPEDYPGARRLEQDACIHCHQVFNFRHEVLWTTDRWSKDRMWVYPPPENVGLKLDVDQGDRVEAVEPRSPADKAGLRAGDVLERLNSFRVSSQADVQYALHRAPESGSVPINWTRDGTAMAAELRLAKGWRRSDVSWRASMWTMPPVTGVYGKDLTAEDKRELGLDEQRLAFRMGDFVPEQPRKAGIRAGDIIIGIDGRRLELTMRQFNLFVRENYSVGDRVTFNVIREGNRLDLPMTLTARTTW